MNRPSAGRRTPLYDRHDGLGARMVSFGGWDMPLMYADITSEHHAVREHAGLFDLSHMGRIRLRGPDAAECAGRIQTADAAGLTAGRTRYGLVLTEEGGIIDDILISREEDGFLLVVNAGRREEDLACIRKAVGTLDTTILDETLRLAMIAIQGPLAERILGLMGLGAATDLGYYRFAEVAGPLGTVIVSRTGYTGEDGFEIILPAELAGDLWDLAIERGSPEGLVPCGLGARDTLRLEAGMPLYGHEIGLDVNPFEAGLEFAVRFNHAFTGRPALELVRQSGPARRLVGLIVDGPRVPRQGCEVLADDSMIGRICSGTRSPTLGVNVATAHILSEHASHEEFEVDIRGHRAPAHRTSLPFHRKKDD